MYGISLNFIKKYLQIFSFAFSGFICDWVKKFYVPLFDPEPPFKIDWYHFSWGGGGGGGGEFSKSDTLKGKKYEDLFGIENLFEFLFSEISRFKNLITWQSDAYS